MAKRCVSLNHVANGQQCAICDRKLVVGDRIDQITFDDDPPMPDTGKKPRYWTHAECSKAGQGTVGE